MHDQRGSVSTAFLISYLTYHYHVGDVRFQGHGGVRPVYFTILITHVILAAGDPAVDRDHAVAGARRPLRIPSADRARDLAAMGLCFGDRRDCLSDVLPDVSAGVSRSAAAREALSVAHR